MDSIKAQKSVCITRLTFTFCRHSPWLSSFAACFVQTKEEEGGEHQQREEEKNEKHRLDEKRPHRNPGSRRIRINLGHCNFSVHDPRPPRPWPLQPQPPWTWSPRPRPPKSRPPHNWLWQPRRGRNLSNCVLAAHSRPRKSHCDSAAGCHGHDLGLLKGGWPPWSSSFSKIRRTILNTINKKTKKYLRHSKKGDISAFCPRWLIVVAVLFTRALFEAGTASY